MSNKSPFELRTRMLELAQDYLEDQYERNVEFAQSVFLESVKIGTATINDWEKFVPQKYNFDEIVKKAQELYSFVEKRN